MEGYSLFRYHAAVKGVWSGADAQVTPARAERVRPRGGRLRCLHLLGYGPRCHESEEMR